MITYHKLSQVQGCFPRFYFIFFDFFDFFHLFYLLFHCFSSFSLFFFLCVSSFCQFLKLFFVFSLFPFFSVCHFFSFFLSHTPSTHTRLTDPKAFCTLATWKVMDLRCWPSSVLTSNFLCPPSYTLLPSAVVKKSFALDPLDSVKGWLVNQSTGTTVSPAHESTTRGFGNGAQVFCWSSHRSVLPFSKKLMPASVRLEERTLGFLMVRFRIRFHRHRIPGRTVLIPSIPVLCHCLGPLPLDQQRIWCLSWLMSILSCGRVWQRVWREHTNHCLSRFSPESTFPTREHHIVSSHVPHCSFLMVFVAPNLYLRCSNLDLLTIPFWLSNLYCHSNLCCLPSFPFLFAFPPFA